MFDYYSLSMMPGIWAVDLQAAASFGPFSTDPSMPSNKKTVDVIGVHGVIRPRSNYWSASAEDLSKRITESANDPNIKTVVFDFNTPGGYIAGIPELAGQIRELGKTKQTIGVANHMAASAGYWLASQANTFYASPGGIVGSIGVIHSHTDMSKMLEKHGIKVTNIVSAPRKAEGNPHEPLSEDAKTNMQAEVDHYHSMFVSAVAQGRRVDPSVVSQTYGGGAPMNAHKAMSAGMIDGIKSLSDVLAELEAPDRNARRQAMYRSQMQQAATHRILGVYRGTR